MKVLSLIQGTPEWHQHRATHFNASDAPAMLGVSIYKTRKQLLDECATGIAPEIDAATQRRFDDGHRVEALARPLAELIIGDELYPVIGMLDDPESRLSASFDGLTLDESTTWEHKRLNQTLRDVLSRDDCTGANLPEMYRVQMEQQALVSGAERVLFMASEWDADGNVVAELHCWYTPDAALRARIIAGWAQFERDLSDYTPTVAPASAPVAHAQEMLPTIRVDVSGQIAIKDNLDAFDVRLRAFLDCDLIREPKTDQDFVDLEAQIKEMKRAEDALAAAGDSIIAQVESVDAVMRRRDAMLRLTRDNRLMAEKLLKVEKERRRAEIVQHYIDQVRAHYADINATLGEHALPVPTAVAASIGNAIKSRKTLGSITDAADAACAAAKIEASQQAERVRQNIAVLAEYADHARLFADRVALCASKTPEDLRNLVAARIAEHAERDAERLEAERTRIRAEEQAKAERDERLRQQAEMERLQRGADARGIVTSHMPPAHESAVSRTGAAAVQSAITDPIATDGAQICLRDINAAIAPLSITADGLAHFGFQPITRQRAAKLYAAADFDRIRAALITTIQRATIKQEIAA